MHSHYFQGWVSESAGNQVHTSDVQIQAPRIQIRIHPFCHESESEYKSTPFQLQCFLGLNQNPNPNPAQKAGP